MRCGTRRRHDRQSNRIVPTTCAANIDPAAGTSFPTNACTAIVGFAGWLNHSCNRYGFVAAGVLSRLQMLTGRPATPPAAPEHNGNAGSPKLTWIAVM